ncbi:MAG: ion channel [Parvibaculaceae bacterium]
MDDQIAPSPVLEILVGVLILIIIIFVHGMGMRLVNRRFSAAWARVTPTTPRWRTDTLLAIAIGLLAVIHLIETLLWALPLYLADIIPGMRDCYYYVLESYTTLGEGNVVLPERWRLIGPIIAMSGLFTFGWTSSVLVSIMTEFGKLDRARARKSIGET